MEINKRNRTLLHTFTIDEVKELLNNIIYERKPCIIYEDKKISVRRIVDHMEIGFKCVSCDRVGMKYCLEKEINALHLDLYSADGEMMTLDHIIPKSKGGKDHISNYQMMCEECNTAKSNHSVSIEEIPQLVLREKERRMAQEQGKHMTYKHVPCAPPNPVFCEDKIWGDERDPGWYFWDEIWSIPYGPYKTEKECQDQLTTYAKNLVKKEVAE